MPTPGALVRTGQGRRVTGRVLDPDDVVEVDTLRHKLVDALGEAVFETEYEKGAALGLDSCIASQA